MKRFLFGLMLAAGLSGTALAQGTPNSATVVAACGTPPATYTAGQNKPLLQDTTGRACETATIGTVTNPVGVKGVDGSGIATNANPVPVQPGSSTPAQLGTTGSSQVLCAAACQLYAANVTITATAGYLLIYNATSVPGDGSVTPRVCLPVRTNGTNGYLAVAWPLGKTFSTGATAAFSTTGCFTQTLATAAFISGDAK